MTRNGFIELTWGQMLQNADSYRGNWYAILRTNDPGNIVTAFPVIMSKSLFDCIKHATQEFGSSKLLYGQVGAHGPYPMYHIIE